MSDQMVRRFCGNCKHHDDRRQVCLLNLSYAAFVYGYSEAGDCPGYETSGAVAEQTFDELTKAAQQSACRPTIPASYGYWPPVKP